MSNIYHVLKLDVYGNPDDGFEVNDKHHVGTVTINDVDDDAEIIHALVIADILVVGTLPADLDIDGDEHALYINDPMGDCPVLELRRHVQ